MSSAAPTPLFEARTETRPKQTNGAHERVERAVEVRVIPGSLLSEQKPMPPRHARAYLIDGMRGAPFGLSFRERAGAWAIGSLFVLAALVTAIYS